MADTTERRGESLSPLSAGEVALGSLLEESHNLHPDDLAAAVARRAAMVGASHAEMLIADRQQHVLLNLADVGAEPVPINTTLAGRCFRTSEVVLGDPVDGGGGQRVFLPLLDGAERVGVLAVDVASTDAVTMSRLRQLASLAAELFVSKRSFGDGPVLAQRAREMTIAAELRWAVMPPLTFATERAVITGALEPAYDVAGDTFDYAANGDVLHMAVFDAMGHGLTAGRMANLACISYRNARRRGLGMADTAAFIEEVMVDQFGSDTTFVTGHLGELSMSTGRLSLLNRGHPRPLLLRAMRTASEVQCHRGVPIGVGPLGGEPAESISEIALEPGDGVLFYSDGVTEARSPSGEEFGEERLTDLLVRAAASGETPPEMLRRLTHAVLEHQEGRLDDDATLLLVHWRG